MGIPITVDAISAPPVLIKDQIYILEKLFFYQSSSLLSLSNENDPDPVISCGLPTTFHHVPVPGLNTYIVHCSVHCTLHCAVHCAVHCTVHCTVH